MGKSVGFELLNLDDVDYVLRNPWVPDGLTLAAVQWALTTFEGPYYMPLTRLSFLLDSSLYGGATWGYHLSNLILHAVNSLLVLQLARRLQLPAWTPLAVAALFAVHPQHLEAVAWVAERKEVLSACFGLLCLISYAGFRRATAPAIQNRQYLLALLFYLLSMLAKPMWITLPALLVILDWWPLRLRTEELIRGLRDKLPFALVAVAFLLIHVLTAPGVSSGYSITGYGPESLFHRASGALLAWAHYFVQSVLPFGLNTYAPYPENPIPLAQALAAAGLLLFVTALAWTLRQSRPHLLAGWLWFSVGLSPAIGIGLLDLMGMAGLGEAVLYCLRFTYMPHIGLFAALCVELQIWSRKAPRFGTIIGPLLAAYVALLGIASFVQSEYWRDTNRFWQRSIAMTDGHYFAHYLLASHLSETGAKDAAIRHLEIAQDQAPTNPFIALRLGDLYWFNDRPRDAYGQYERLLGEALGPPDMLHMQALIFWQNGERQLAEVFRLAAREQGLTRKQEKRNLKNFNAALRSGEDPR